MKIILIMGLPGSGKTTLAKKLLRKSKSSGYKSSFIVLEKNGKAYDLDKYLSEI